MDPDIVRQQEEAEAQARLLQAKQPPSRRVIDHAPLEEAAVPNVPREAQATLPPLIAPKPAAGDARRALPPMGTGRLPGEPATPPKRVSGLTRLFLYTLGGGAVGGALGFVGTNYFDLYKAQQELFIASTAAGCALLFGLTHLLHYDR